MITKATIISKLSDSSYSVMIPIFDDPNYSDEDFVNSNIEATVSTLPNFNLNLKKGDLVFVDFENNQTFFPIIVGVSSTVNDSLASGSLDTLNVETDVKLPTNITIGEDAKGNKTSWKVTGEEIKHLTGLSSNAQGQMNTLNEMCQSIVRLSVQGNSLVMVDNPWGLDTK